MLGNVVSWWFNAIRGAVRDVGRQLHDMVAASASAFVPDAVVAAHGSIRSRRGVGSQGVFN